MAAVLRVLGQLPLALLSPLVAVLSYIALSLADFFFLVFGRRRPPVDAPPDTSAASVVIPNWNGRDLLESYLPSIVEALCGNARNEIIVVDNGSTDDSVAFLRARFPGVRVIALEHNLGFGGGSNRGFREARNDIVVLLNSDMRVAPDFLAPLLAAFTDEKVFSVACQIFFSDPARRREETGLTQAWWSQGSLRVRHVEDPDVTVPFPCAYGGGGSCAFDRRKFLELGGFDEVFRPFYLEDTDVGYMAWKRGWKVFYQPASHVWHEHRGTIGKTFSRTYIDRVIRKNFLLFGWKNIHEPRRLAAHFAYAWATALVSVLAGDSLERASLGSLFRAFFHLPGVLSARWRARALGVITDSEALRRPLGGYFRDRFEPFDETPDRVRVLFLSPYSLCPPIHGGGVFMNQTVRTLSLLADVHLLVLVDSHGEIEAHEEIRPFVRSMAFVVRPSARPKGVGRLLPHAIREFAFREADWILHREIFLHKIHVVQVEYTSMAQYVGPYRRIAWHLFEHDIYFQSIARALRGMSLMIRLRSMVEYVRALRYELRTLPRFDRIQTCSAENRRYLVSFSPELDARIDDDSRAGVDTAAYEFRLDGRRDDTMLFLGSFRHPPNVEALTWFLQHVMPLVLEQRPQARLSVVGSDPPVAYSIPDYDGAVDLRGFVDDIRGPLAENALFVCPILSGSGMRVKLLEAFAAGIPVVSTRLGAEGLGTGEDGVLCALADTPREFAGRILRLLESPEEAAAMALRARRYVETERDMRVLARRLEQSYRRALSEKARQRPS